MIDTYISIDLETTGLDPKRDRIIEIGAVRVEDGIRTGEFETFINPGRRLEERIVELTGITDEQLNNAPRITEVMPQLLEFMGDAPLLGHHVIFDYSFLKKAAVDQKLPFERRGIDTLKIARKYLPQLEHRSLDYLCEYYGIEHHAHRALADAKATEELYRHLADLYFTPEENLFAPAQLIYHAKRDTPATKAQKEQLLRLAELHKIELCMDVEELTRSEASRMADKIRSHSGT